MSEGRHYGDSSLILFNISIHLEGNKQELRNDPV